ncbi:MAG: dienelactone hydrolase family protein [Acidimicrobiales bacterium]
MAGLEWTSESSEQRVTERGFTLTVGEQAVFGIAWTPTGADRWPTVLIGHGGTQHKRTPGVLSLARRLVRHLGYGAVAIDAPEHGDRRSAPQERFTPEQMRARTAGLSSEDLALMVQRNATAVSEWRAVLDALETTPGFSSGPFGYWGVSMGTAIGLPYAASDSRVVAAVLGLAGLGDRLGSDRLAAAARSLAIPVLFLFQWNDELIAPEHGIALFEAMGTKDKTMHVNPGGHLEMPFFERDAVEAFFRRHMGNPA